jgi:hypothetical protein
MYAFLMEKRDTLSEEQYLEGIASQSEDLIDFKVDLKLTRQGQPEVFHSIIYLHTPEMCVCSLRKTLTRDLLATYNYLMTKVKEHNTEKYTEGFQCFMCGTKSHYKADCPKK